MLRNANTRVRHLGLRRGLISLSSWVLSYSKQNDGTTVTCRGGQLYYSSVSMFHRSLEVLSWQQLFGIGLTRLLWYGKGFDSTSFAPSKSGFSSTLRMFKNTFLQMSSLTLSLLFHRAGGNARHSVPPEVFECFVSYSALRRHLKTGNVAFMFENGSDIHSPVCLCHENSKIGVQGYYYTRRQYLEMISLSLVWPRGCTHRRCLTMNLIYFLSLHTRNVPNVSNYNIGSTLTGHPCSKR